VKNACSGTQACQNGYFISNPFVSTPLSNGVESIPVMRRRKLTGADLHKYPKLVIVGSFYVLFRRSSSRYLLS
jgi:hypothetical protein